MSVEKNPPFRSKAERDQETDLQAKYRELGNPDLVAALRHQTRKPAERPAQMQASLSKREHE